MKRFHCGPGLSRPAPEVDAFITEVLAVCRKHGMCIEHEDTHGGFVIERRETDQADDWLASAMVGRTLTP